MIPVLECNPLLIILYHKVHVMPLRWHQYQRLLFASVQSCEEGAMVAGRIVVLLVKSICGSDDVTGDGHTRTH